MKRGLLWAAILGGAATAVRLAIKTPVLMLHGTADQEVPYSQTLEMAEALKKSHKEYTAVTFKDAGHALTGKDEKGERTITALLACAPQQHSTRKRALFHGNRHAQYEDRPPANLVRFGMINGPPVLKAE